MLLLTIFEILSSIVVVIGESLISESLIVVPNVGLIVPEHVVFHVAMHQMVLGLERFVDVETGDAFNCRKTHHGIVSGNREFIFMDSLFEGTPIVCIHPHHHELNRAAKANNHDLAVMHGRVPQVVNPHGYQVQHAGEKTESVRPAKRLAYLSVHDSLKALPLSLGLLSGLNYWVAWRWTAVYHINNQL